MGLPKSEIGSEVGGMTGKAVDRRRIQYGINHLPDPSFSPSFKQSLGSMATGTILSVSLDVSTYGVKRLSPLVLAGSNLEQRIVLRCMAFTALNGLCEALKR